MRRFPWADGIGGQTGSDDGIGGLSAWGLDDRVRGLRGDAAHVAFVASNHDEAFVTPLLAPTVLHDPVVFALHGSVPDTVKTIMSK